MRGVPTYRSRCRPPSTELWRGLEELGRRPAEFREMLHREFPEDATAWADPVTRRHVPHPGRGVAALAGVGCSPRIGLPREDLPVRQAAARDHPRPAPLLRHRLHRSTASPPACWPRAARAGRSSSRGTRPTRAASAGSTRSPRPSLLNLYDPDRSRQVRPGQRPVQLRARRRRHARRPSPGAKGEGKADPHPDRDGQLAHAGGRPSPSSSGRTPNSKLVQWEPAGRDNAREGARLAFGEPVNVIYDFTKADGSSRSTRTSWSPSRATSGTPATSTRSARPTCARAGQSPTAEQLNRLYAVESMLTATGAVADHRLPMQSAEVEAFARGLAARRRRRPCRAPPRPSAARPSGGWRPSPRT